ncbi:extensin family protein [Mesorhizobium sp. PAMC28654]|uniref:extensin family protein n=1 Tax=Mesorhizobium sp. PAMC28654 TaxID=2880934 RepID=UPI0022228A85|nr:extensin family protein [Mesorhizobium sp. PAMC28654]
MSAGRHGTRKLSEHAFGNALDIASFTLSDGKKIEISPSPPEKDAKFLNAVRKAACGPFKTVLGPASDADHSLHFHLDLEPRRHGGTFCQ